MLEDFIAAYEYLKSHPECEGKIGVVGFCFGVGADESSDDGCFVAGGRINDLYGLPARSLPGFGTVLRTFDRDCRRGVLVAVAAVCLSAASLGGGKW